MDEGEGVFGDLLLDAGGFGLGPLGLVFGEPWGGGEIEGSLAMAEGIFWFCPSEFQRVFKFGKVRSNLAWAECGGFSVSVDGFFAKYGANVADRHSEGLSGGLLGVIGPEMVGEGVSVEVCSGSEGEKGGELFSFAGAELFGGGGGDGKPAKCSDSPRNGVGILNIVGIHALLLPGWGWKWAGGYFGKL